MKYLYTFEFIINISDKMTLIASTGILEINGKSFEIADINIKIEDPGVHLKQIIRDVIKEKLNREVVFLP